MLKKNDFVSWDHNPGRELRGWIDEIYSMHIMNIGWKVPQGVRVAKIKLGRKTNRATPIVSLSKLRLTSK